MDSQKEQLVSVIADVEKTCISKLTGTPQSVLRRAIEHDDTATVLLEHGKLLGDETRAGLLGEKFSYDYEGSTAPKEISRPKK